MTDLERRIEAACKELCEGTEPRSTCGFGRRTLAASDEVLHELLDRVDSYDLGAIRQIRAALSPRREK